MRPLRIYVDTSVLGGCFDDEFREDSLRLWHEFATRTKILVLSDLVAEELERAPPEVKQLVADLPDDALEKIALDEEAIELAEAYLQAGIVAQSSLSDARHIAMATIANVDAIVSWNFAHIVNLGRIRQYHAANIRLGYPMIEIRTPREVLENEDQSSSPEA